MRVATWDWRTNSQRSCQSTVSSTFGPANGAYSASVEYVLENRGNEPVHDILVNDLAQKPITDLHFDRAGATSTFEPPGAVRVYDSQLDLPLAPAERVRLQFTSTGQPNTALAMSCRTQRSSAMAPPSTVTPFCGHLVIWTCGRPA